MLNISRIVILQLKLAPFVLQYMAIFECHIQFGTESTCMVFLYQSSLSQPQMMVVADLDDVFLPLPDDLLVNLVDSRHVVESFLDSLPNMFHDNVNVESALGPALKAAFMVMV